MSVNTHINFIFHLMLLNYVLYHYNISIIYVPLDYKGGGKGCGEHAQVLGRGDGAGEICNGGVSFVSGFP